MNLTLLIIFETGIKSIFYQHEVFDFQVNEG